MSVFRSTALLSGLLGSAFALLWPNPLRATQLPVRPPVQVPVQEVRIKFAGSFQCRLATNDDRTNDSPTDLLGTYGLKGKGWTFSYKEPRFDRLIRLSKPLALRGAGLDPWTNTVITSVEVDRGGGRQPVLNDALLKKVVSLGDKVVFDEKAGGGAGRETLENFQFGIEGKFLIGFAQKTPQLTGKAQIDKVAANDYERRKPNLVKAAPGIDPVRKKDMEDPDLLSTRAFFFSLGIPTHPCELRQVDVKGATGVLADMGKPDDYDWTLTMFFSRYDGDTLTGQVEGELRAVRRLIVFDRDADPITPGGKTTAWKCSFDGKSSIWVVERMAKGRYKITEKGLGNAEGNATYDSSTKTLTAELATKDGHWAATTKVTVKNVDRTGLASFEPGVLKFTIHSGRKMDNPPSYKATLEAAKMP